MVGAAILNAIPVTNRLKTKPKIIPMMIPILLFITLSPQYKFFLPYMLELF